MQWNTWLQWNTQLTNTVTCEKVVDLSRGVAVPGAGLQLTLVAHSSSLHRVPPVALAHMWSYAKLARWYTPLVAQTPTTAVSSKWQLHLCLFDGSVLEDTRCVLSGPLIFTYLSSPFCLMDRVCNAPITNGASFRDDWNRQFGWILECCAFTLYCTKAICGNKNR